MWLLLLTDSGQLLRSWVSHQEWTILSFLWRRQEVTEMGRESPQRIAFLRLVWFRWQEHNFQRKIPPKHPAYITFIQQTRVSLLVFGDILFLAGRFWISIQNEHPWRHLGSFTIVQLRDCIQRKGALAFIKMSVYKVTAFRVTGCTESCGDEPPGVSFYFGDAKEVLSSPWGCLGFLDTHCNFILTCTSQRACLWPGKLPDLVLSCRSTLNCFVTEPEATPAPLTPLPIGHQGH